MKKHTCMLVAAALMLAMFAGCAQKPATANPSASTIPTTADPPPVTTVPATTAVPSVEYKVTYKTLCNMIDEAEEYLLNNETVKAQMNFYTQVFVDRRSLLRRGYVSEESGYYVFSDHPDEEIHLFLRHLLFLSNLVSQYEDDMVWTNYEKGLGYQGHITYTALLVVGYENYGYKTVKDYFDAGCPLEENVIEYRISFNAAHITMNYRDGDHTITYRILSVNPNAPTLHNGLATEPSRIDPKEPEYTGDGIPPC